MTIFQGTRTGDQRKMGSVLAAGSGGMVQYKLQTLAEWSLAASSGRMVQYKLKTLGEWSLDASSGRMIQHKL